MWDLAKMAELISIDKSYSRVSAHLYTDAYPKITVHKDSAALLQNFYSLYVLRYNNKIILEVESYEEYFGTGLRY